MLGLLNLYILFLCNYTLIPEPSGARSSTDLTVDSLLCADNIVNIPHTPCVKLDIFLVTSVGTHHHLFIGPSLLQYNDFLGQTVHFVVEFVHTKLTMLCPIAPEPIASLMTIVCGLCLCLRLLGVSKGCYELYLAFLENSRVICYPNYFKEFSDVEVEVFLRHYTCGLIFSSPLLFVVNQSIAVLWCDVILTNCPQNVSKDKET